ncbi:DUF4870 domain-containing protein [Pollutibacter soli]|uniref:DUF4870 domain-containing protein n=1 Tax=Pollutibacter soli TaxID=3034157 RepID=UPI003013544D
MSTNSGNTEYLGTETTPTYTPNGDERTLAILVHVLSIFFWLFPALIIYLIKKDESPFVAAHAKEQLNFQITISIVYIALFISIVGIFFLWVPGIFVLIFCIIGAIKASDLKLYRFPMNWRIIK